MRDNKTPVARQTHLKLAVVFLCVWLFVVYQLYDNIQQAGGLPGFIEVIGGGDYSDLILLALSIFLLAYFFRSLFMYFALKDDASQV